MEILQDRYTFREVGDGADPRDLLAEIASGLSAQAKRLPCRYLYDEEGSRLFELICGLEEYYPTRAEAEILRDRAGELAAGFSEGASLVELGSGSAAKTRFLIEAFLDRHGSLCYVPVDISSSALEESSRDLLREHDELTIHAVLGDYLAGIRSLGGLVESPRLVLWLGSNVGNLHPPVAAEHLLQLSRELSPEDRVLVGIDLKKDPGILQRAYDDSEGVTARFNLNLLARINRELGGTFDLDAFHHEAVYDEDNGRMRMYLVADRAQRVEVPGLDLDLEVARGERIHTEDSYKYSVEDIEGLAARGRFRVARQWLDRGGRFSATLLAPLAAS